MTKVKKIEYPDWVIFEAARLANPQKDRGRTQANVYSDMAKRWLALYGGAGRRVNVTGLYDQSTGRYRKSGMKKGFEDVDGILPLELGVRSRIGLKVAIEVKVGRDRMSDEQKERQREVESAGGIYVVFKEPDQFVYDVHRLVFEKLGAMINPALPAFPETGFQP